MFDSRSLRRKLGSLMPGENVRQHVQNVFTVEWDTHKTVLVEVPGANQRSPDVEMEGLGLNRQSEREGYGRLGDDEEDYVDSPYSNNPNMAIEPHSSSGSNYGSGSYFDRPISRPHQSRSQSYNSDKRLPSIPASPAAQRYQASRQERHEDALNPFVSIDDFAPGVPISSSGFLQPQRTPTQPTRSRTMEQGWNTFGDDSSRGASPVGYGATRGQSQSHVAQRRMEGDERIKEPTSPTSSRGTRDSAQTTSTADENPFR